ncbi:MAG: alpha/beta fold hydrolase [Acidobacteriaceae bacterium]
MLFDREGALWWVDLPSGEARRRADTGVAPGDDPKISPDGLRISYLTDHNLVTVSVAGGPESAVTHTDGVGKPVLNGQLDWIYEEELSAQSNYFWSPDSRQIAYLQMDESKVPAYPLVDWLPVHATTEMQYYPQPGDPNPGVRLGVVKAAGGETRWINLPISENNDYIPRFGWMNDHTLWIEVLRRSQKKREFFLADAATGASQAIASDEDPKYLAMNYNAEFLDDGRFLFPSWRDGHTHLYLYRAERTGDTLPQTATFQRELEQGDYEVQSGAIAESFFRVTGYRPAGPKANSVPRIFYISNEGEAIGSRLWTMGIDGSGKRDLTPTEGTHRIQISPNGAYFVDTNSSYSRTPAVALCTTSDGACRELERYTPPAGFHRPEPKPLTLRAADGTPLYGTLTLPASTAPDSVPLVVNPYGGPAVREATDEWSSGGFDRVLTEHGFAVLHVDNRGMGGRSRDFEQVCYHNFGPVELADQLGAVDSVLKQYPQLDPKRLGWMGYSWGGTFTAYALTHSDRFRAGMAGSGVMDWHSYDSIYTERYLGLPVEDKPGYADGSVINSAAGLHGRLLIEQGTADDNAHLQNAIQFIQALIEAGRPYDLELTPGASHRHYESASDESDLERTLAHFETWLKAAPDANRGAAAGR